MWHEKDIYHRFVLNFDFALVLVADWVWKKLKCYKGSLCFNFFSKFRRCFLCLKSSGVPFPLFGTVKPTAALKNDDKGLSDRFIVKKRVKKFWNFLFSKFRFSAVYVWEMKKRPYLAEKSVKKREPNKTRQKTDKTRHDKTLIRNKTHERKGQWDIRSGSVPSCATKLERKQRYLGKNMELEARCPETII